ncbi:MAG: winged helix-turn-helix transcriptional regulator [Candidatus Thermoplasmatota archaeon]|nr:winged helix-turn-helix transcriptional regulator [Candidatus Thermoplasmatota archaeon]
MHSKNGVLIVLGFCIFILLFIEPVLSEQNNFLNLLSNSQLAESDEKLNIISEVSIIGIIAAIVTIIAIATFGGIKYVTPENVLDTEVRKNLYEFIDEYPGSHLREIARELKLKPSNAAWHLRKLEQTNLIRSRAIGGKKVFYLVEGGIETRREAVAESILRNKNAYDIMYYLSNNPGKHLLEIAHALDLNHHTVKWHIKKMYMAELIEGDTSNSAYPVYYATEIGVHAITNINQQSRKIGRAS